MEFTRLPNELLDYIVEFTLPHGFESIALTCKRFHTLCKPLIKRHNKLRSRFYDFAYYMEPVEPVEPCSIVTACDLITLIAAEPLVARYIRAANLECDTSSLTRAYARGEEIRSMPSIDDGGAVIELFANSIYLRQAGLNWQEYYSTFAQDVKENRYSQHGAAFLLTLLRDVKNLIIPTSWKPNAATSKLLDVIVDKAKQQTPLSRVSSLSSVTRFEGVFRNSKGMELTLASWAPFLLSRK